MAFLGSVLESYDSLIAGRVGNCNMTKEDYDQIDPEEMELMDIMWNMASIMRRAQKFTEITGRQCFLSSDVKLGYNKSKVTCFKGKQKGHFKRECTGQENQDNINPFSDFYKQAIYHKPQIEARSSKSRDKALVVIQEDEGFNWNNMFSQPDGRAVMAEIIEEPQETVDEEDDENECCNDKICTIAALESAGKRERKIR
ncbi:putative transcription factor interactor and regulator CCHC(Zn) family [Helianthus annuus]|nr:putative transcription factor interactor and regulator CCHC(Zn) family [Helianthus annuus]